MTSTEENKTEDLSQNSQPQPPDDGIIYTWLFALLTGVIGMIIIMADAKNYVAWTCIMTAIIISPPVLQKIPIFLDMKLSSRACAILVVGFITLFFLPSQKPAPPAPLTEEKRAELIAELREDFESRRDSILTSARAAMKEKDYEKVERLADRYWVLEDKELNDLYAEARRQIVAKKEKGRADAIKAQANKSGATDVEASVMATSVCEQRVRQHLKAPRTAKFPWRKNVTFDGEAATVISYVDAQNAFGAMLRTHYICAVKFLGGRPMDMPNWQITEFVVLD